LGGLKLMRGQRESALAAGTWFTTEQTTCRVPSMIWKSLARNAIPRRA
jgi:hypothetical protein